MFKMLTSPLQMDSWTKRLEAFIFLLFLTKIKILLPFEYWHLFYPSPLISTMVSCNTLVEN